jgi:hypothetical protein
MSTPPSTLSRPWRSPPKPSRPTTKPILPSKLYGWLS